MGVQLLNYLLYIILYLDLLCVCSAAQAFSVEDRVVVYFVFVSRHNVHGSHLDCLELFCQFYLTFAFKYLLIQVLFIRLSRYNSKFPHYVKLVILRVKGVLYGCSEAFT